MNAERVVEMVRKEFRQVFRDPRMRRVLFVAPVLQLIVFGYAVSTDVRNTRTFVVDNDGTRESRELVETFTASGYFRVVGGSQRPGDLVRALDHGDAVLGLVIPPGFSRDLESGGPARVQLLFDGTNSNVATVAQGYAERIVQSYAARRFPARATPAVDLRARAWYNPELASRDYNVPAVLGAILMLICLLLTSLAIVREREIGTLEQLLVSPLTPGELILGKTIPFALIGLVDLGLITSVALLWFRIPLRGSVLLLLLASLLYILAVLGVGLFISTISRTQQEAFMAVFLTFMPVILLSGFMFPVTSMSPFFRWLTLANPMRHYLEIVRGLFLKGAGFDALWPQFLALLLLGAGILWLAASRFRRSAAG
ncbi:MAG TPA: ABC transporter permease [Thermoanaerobaculia bacterium]|nr:ABC transporter permease [Thermoanaerobaculia bacterium]